MQHTPLLVLPHARVLQIAEPTRSIRAQAWGRDMELVAITGWGQDEDRREAEAAGFDHHRAKPVELDSLDPLFAQARSLMERQARG